MKNEQKIENAARTNSGSERRFTLERLQDVNGGGHKTALTR
jgi:hypothetical protein